ncbi:hypothetical protein [Arhodomonas sp. SL1]|uniref:hypothetical protein n=1 Tax=Arhodomonas sp. SL1 TaxID=3425691 RepID=UPI003F885843
MSPSFPAAWPNDCPPADAESPKGEYYRIVKTNPPSDQDFLSHAERGKSGGGDCCMRCGLSVFSDVEEARHAKKVMPALGEHLVVAALDARHGRTKRTPSRRHKSHVTWWPFEGIGRAELFAVVT